MSMFRAIDVETANADRSSICQIGIVTCDQRGRITVALDCLVNPETDFDARNIAIHGIREKDVRRAITIPRLENQLRHMLTDQIVVSHTDFDRQALNAAFRRYKLAPLRCRWVDSRDVARGTWSLQSYRLSDIAKHLGIKHHHHLAVDDARVSAEIVKRATAQTRTAVEDWLAGTPQRVPEQKKRKGCLSRMFAITLFLCALALSTLPWPAPTVHPAQNPAHTKTPSG